MEMTYIRSFERFKFWGWMVMVLCVIAFLVVLGVSFVLPAFTLAIVGVAIAFVGGVALQIYGSTRIWLSRRRAAPETPARRRAKRTRARGEGTSNV